MSTLVEMLSERGESRDIVTVIDPMGLPWPAHFVRADDASHLDALVRGVATSKLDVPPYRGQRHAPTVFVLGRDPAPSAEELFARSTVLLMDPLSSDLRYEGSLNVTNLVLRTCARLIRVESPTRARYLKDRYGRLRCFEFDPPEFPACRTEPR